MDVFGRLGELRLIPTVALERAADAAPLADALRQGGLPCIEVMLRTAGGLAAVEQLSSKRPDVLVGAGTVLTAEQARQAAAAGAQFLVSPGFSPAVVGWCLDHGVPAIPGAATPTEVEMALGRGLGVVKFFPAEAFGGVRTLEALSAPYSAMRFIPTGGIDASNLKGYLRLPQVLACGGTWMARPELIRAGRWDEVERAVREATALARSLLE